MRELLTLFYEWIIILHLSNLLILLLRQRNVKLSHIVLFTHWTSVSQCKATMCYPAYHVGHSVGQGIYVSFFPPFYKWIIILSYCKLYLVNTNNNMNTTFIHSVFSPPTLYQPSSIEQICVKAWHAWKLKPEAVTVDPENRIIKGILRTASVKFAA